MCFTKMLLVLMQKQSFCSFTEACPGLTLGEKCFCSVALCRLMNLFDLQISYHYELSLVWCKSPFQLCFSYTLILNLSFRSRLAWRFSFFSFPFAVCKDSWEDLTDVVEQLRDDSEGAFHTHISQLLFVLIVGFCAITLSLSAKCS